MDPLDIRKWPAFQSVLKTDSEVDFLIDDVSIDSRRIKGKNSIFIALKGQKTDGHNYLTQAFLNGASFAIVDEKSILSSTIPEKLIVLKVESPLKALQEIAAAYRREFLGKVVAIGGTYGKTMLKEFLQALLKDNIEISASPGSYNSQIGVPLSLLSVSLSAKLALIEIGFSKPFEIDRLIEITAPDYAVITPVESRYLASFKNKEEGEKEWLKLLNAAQNFCLAPKKLLKKSDSCKAISWEDDLPNLPHAVSYSSRSASRLDYQITFREEEPYNGSINAGYSYFVDLLNMGIKSAKLLGIKDSAIKKALQNYTPAPVRIELWHSDDNTFFINDNNLTQTDSFKDAFQSIRGKNPLFIYTSLHENPNDITAQDLASLIIEKKVACVFAIDSPPAKSLQKALKAAHYENILLFQTFEELLKSASEKIMPASAVLLKGGIKLPLERLLKAFSESPPRNECRIHLAAIRENILQLKSHLKPRTRIMAMVKAKAYGTHDERIAAFLETNGVDILGVASVDEGVQLKKCGCRQEVFVLHILPEEAARVVKWGLSCGVCNIETYTALSKEALEQGKKTTVHLHINTGMNRFGCLPQEALTLGALLHQDPNLLLDGVMTHFACAENPDEDLFTKSQIELFDQCIHTLENNGILFNWRHAANSSGTIRWDLPQYNMVRVGLAVYGLHSSFATREKLPLKTAISLYSKVSSITTLKIGESVSYGRRFIAEKDNTRIAVLPIGYFDGLHRHYGGKGHVLIRGKKAPMVGSICMDFMMVDVTNIPDVSIGDQALLFGGDEHRHYLPPEEFAESGNSIIHELMTCLGPRIQRIFIDEETAINTIGKNDNITT